jgi:hypothetical protein
MSRLGTVTVEPSFKQLAQIEMIEQHQRAPPRRIGDDVWQPIAADFVR